MNRDRLGERVFEEVIEGVCGHVAFLKSIAGAVDAASGDRAMARHKVASEARAITDATGGAHPRHAKTCAANRGSLPCHCLRKGGRRHQLVRHFNAVKFLRIRCLMRLRRRLRFGCDWNLRPARIERLGERLDETLWRAGHQRQLDVVPVRANCVVYDGPTLNNRRPVRFARKDHAVG